MQTQTAAKTTSEPLTSNSAVKLKPLRDGLKELEQAYELARASRSALKEKISAIAEKTGLAPAVIRGFLAARMAEDSEKAERQAERAQQLAMIFEEVGT